MAIDIMINDIDVSECKYLDLCNSEDICCNAEQGADFSVVSCSACPDCYYKQLKRIKDILKNFFEEWEKDDLYWDMKMKEATND